MTDRTNIAKRYELNAAGVIHPSARCTIVSVISVSCLNAIGHAQCQYDVTIIEAPYCEPYGYPIPTGSDVNAHGQVVGSYPACVIGQDRPFIWSAELGWTPLPMPPGASRADARAINDHGQIIMQTTTTGYLWDGGVFTELNALPGGVCNVPSDINESSIVTGHRGLGNGACIPHTAYRWTATDGHVDLGLVDGMRTCATAINDRGEVGGWIGPIIGGEGFLWRDGELIRLGVPEGFEHTHVAAMNNRGQAAGAAIGADHGEPALWDDGQWILLGLLDGCDSGGVRDMNDRGQIVGLCAPKEGHRQAFLWQDGTLHNLNYLALLEPGMHLDRGNAISQDGVIVAHGTLSIGRTVTFLLSPIYQVADLDQSCDVGFRDLLLLLVDWQSTDSPADLNDDGIVDALDLTILLSLWG